MVGINIGIVDLSRTSSAGRASSALSSRSSAINVGIVDIEPDIIELFGIVGMEQLEIVGIDKGIVDVEARGSVSVGCRGLSYSTISTTTANVEPISVAMCSASPKMMRAAVRPASTRSVHNRILLCVRELRRVFERPFSL